MQIDVNLRAQAASALLDAVSVMTAEDSGSDDADRRALLALEPMSLDLTNDPRLAATLAAATDLLWMLTRSLSQWNGVSREAMISTIRSEILPKTYFDADLYREQ